MLEFRVESHCVGETWCKKATAVFAFVAVHVWSLGPTWCNLHWFTVGLFLLLEPKKPSQLKHGKHGKHGCVNRMNLVFLNMCDDCMWPSQSFPENMFSRHNILRPEMPHAILPLTCALYVLQSAEASNEKCQIWRPSPNYFYPKILPQNIFLPWYICATSYTRPSGNPDFTKHQEFSSHTKKSLQKVHHYKCKQYILYLTES